MLHQIGAGALGPVFRAYQPEQDRLVAVKLFRLDLPPDQVHRLVASLEALVEADLSHPGIAAPVGTGLSDVAAYLAQDFVAADSLDVVVRSAGGSSLVEVAHAATQLASALDFAAAQGILHGALHPRDVLMSSDDVRLTGLGVTQALERVGIHTPVRRPYSAPERAVHGPWDRRADVFSLAALMFELLFGRRVSGAGAQAVASLREIAGTNQSALKRVFARALAADAADRFDTAVAFADDLRVAITDVAPPAVSLDMPPRADAKAPAQEFQLTTDDEEAQPSELLLPLDAPDFDLSEPVAEYTTVVASSEDLLLQTREALLGHSRVPVAPRSEPAADEATIAAGSPPFAATALESTRSAVWPLVLALCVGIAIGFGMAMVLIGRSQSPNAIEQAQGPPSPPVAVAEPPIVPVTELSRPAATNASAQPSTPPEPTPPSTPPATPVAPSAAPQAAPPRAAAAAPRPSGRIVVRSTPAGAQVFLNGRSAGVTPVTLREVSRGSHTVRVVRQGYVTAERRVVVSASNQGPSVVVTLVRPRPAPRASAPQPPTVRPVPSVAAQSGSLLVESRPTGAALFVDGKLVGTTPLLLSTLDPGDHAIHLEHAGYRRWSGAVKIVGGERARVAASLEP